MRQIWIAGLVGMLAAVAIAGPVTAQDCSTRLAELEGRMTKLEPTSEQRRNLQELVEAARVFEWMEHEQGCLVVLSEAEELLEPAEAAAEEQVQRQEEAATQAARGELESVPPTGVPPSAGLTPEGEGGGAPEPDDERAAAFPTAPPPEPADQAAGPEVDQGPLGEVPASDLIGREVQDEEGEMVAEVVDLVRQAENDRMFAVIRVGGFLGLGTKEVAVPLADLEPGGADGLRLAATADQLERLPPYNPAQYVEPDE